MPDGLSGRTIVITRPLDQAQSLADRVRQAGGTPVLFPLLEIAPCADSPMLDAALDRTADCDWAIFISSNAVQHGMACLLRRQGQTPPGLRFAAIGPVTAAELGRYGIDTVLTPQDRYDSESLLALPQMRDVAGQRIAIFRGVGGRELLGRQLAARGAEVHFVECYRRICPQTDTNELQRLWQNRQLHAVVVTSSEAMRHLVRLAGEATWLRAVLLCVNHPRIAEQAPGLRVAVAAGPGDDAMLQCLIRHAG